MSMRFVQWHSAVFPPGPLRAAPDVRGIDQVFNFFAVPGPATCFEGVQALQPGQYLRLQFDRLGQPATIEKQLFWEIDFPDEGQEDPGPDEQATIDRLESLM